jgi:hypothetical protein
VRLQERADALRHVPERFGEAAQRREPSHSGGRVEAAGADFSGRMMQPQQVAPEGTHPQEYQCGDDGETPPPS